METKSVILALSTVLALFTVLLTIVSGTPIPDVSSAEGQAASTTSAIIQEVTPEGAILGVLLIIGGLILTFFGYRLMDLVLFLTGFYVGGLVSYIILINESPAGGYANWVIIVVVVLVGLVVGLLTLCLWRLGVVLLGGLLGLCLGLWILTWQPGGLISSETGQIIFLTVLALVCGVLTLVFMKPVLIIGTAIVGAYSFITGVDVFAHTGFTVAAYQFLNRNSTAQTYTMDSQMYGMLAGFIIMAIVGAIVQFVHTRKHNWKHPAGHWNTHPYRRRYAAAESEAEAEAEGKA